MDQVEREKKEGEKKRKKFQTLLEKNKKFNLPEISKKSLMYSKKFLNLLSYRFMDKLNIFPASNKYICFTWFNSSDAVSYKNYDFLSIIMKGKKLIYLFESDINKEMQCSGEVEFKDFDIKNNYDFLFEYIELVLESKNKHVLEAKVLTKIEYSLRDYEDSDNSFSYEGIEQMKRNSYNDPGVQKGLNEIRKKGIKELKKRKKEKERNKKRMENKNS